MAQIPKIINVAASYVPGDPNAFAQNLEYTAQEDSPEKTAPILAYEGYNFLPTEYGYKSYFGETNTLNIAGLASRCSDLLMFQTSGYVNILIALCEDGIWTSNPAAAAGAWTHVTTIAFDAAVFKQWTTTFLNGSLYCYQEANATVDILAPAGTWTTMVPTFLNMAGQKGIFRAGGRLGFWDSANSVSWSSALNYQDFTTSLTTMAGNTKFRDVIGNIVTIHPHSDGFIIYSTKSIVGVHLSNSVGTLWNASVVSSITGIAYSTHVCTGATDAQHFVFTSIGLYMVGSYSLSERNHAFQPLLTGTIDFIKESLLPVRLICLEGRYVFISLVDSTYIDGIVGVETVTIDGLSITVLGWNGVLADLPPILGSTQTYGLMNNIVQGGAAGFGGIITQTDIEYTKITLSSLLDLEKYPDLGTEYTAVRQAAIDQGLSFGLYAPQPNSRSLVANPTSILAPGETKRWVEVIGTNAISANFEESFIAYEQGLEDLKNYQEASMKKIEGISYTTAYHNDDTAAPPPFADADTQIDYPAGYFGPFITGKTTRELVETTGPLLKDYTLEIRDYFTEAFVVDYLQSRGITMLPSIWETSTNRMINVSNWGNDWIAVVKGTLYASSSMTQYESSIVIGNTYLEVLAAANAYFLTAVEGVLSGPAPMYASIGYIKATALPAKADYQYIKKTVTYGPTDNIISTTYTQNNFCRSRRGTNTSPTTTIYHNLNAVTGEVVWSHTNLGYPLSWNPVFMEYSYFQAFVAEAQTLLRTEYAMVAPLVLQNVEAINVAGHFGLRVHFVDYTDPLNPVVTYTDYMCVQTATLADRERFIYLVTATNSYRVRKVTGKFGYSTFRAKTTQVGYGNWPQVTPNLPAWSAPASYPTGPTGSFTTNGGTVSLTTPTIDGVHLLGDTPPLTITYPKVSYNLINGTPAPLYPSYAGALVLDVQLKKWGKYKGTHALILDYNPQNSTQNGSIPYTNFGVRAGTLKPVGTGTIHLFDHRPTASYIRYGKIGYYRLGFTQMQEVTAHFRTPSSGSITLESSLDGRMLDSSLVHTTNFFNEYSVTGNEDISARWHTIKISGQWDLQYLEVRGTIRSRR